MPETNNNPGLDLQSVLTPEGVLMLFWAMMLDIAGFLDLIPVVGWILTFIVSIVGFFTIGVWSWFRTRGGVKGKMKKWLTRTLTVTAIEMLPFGSFVPGWTILVIVTLATQNMDFPGAKTKKIGRLATKQPLR